MQHDLARTFTLIISVGMIGSLIIGTLLDRIGLEWCTVLTLLMGQIHMIIIYSTEEATTTTTSKSWMIMSFWIYMLFRNFLYPAYISSLTERLGFKYFGVLLGIGFALSGITQLSMTGLDELVQGDCHDESVQSPSIGEATIDEESSNASVTVNFNKAEIDCNHGSWRLLHVVQFLQLGCLMLCPFLDKWDEKRRKEKLVQMMKESEGQDSKSTNYGSVAS